MADQQVPATITPMNATTLFAALEGAWPILFPGQTPGRASLLTLIAQSAFETGQWASCRNFNLGNIKHVPGDGFDFFAISCAETVNGQSIIVPNCMFRAYPNLPFAAQSYLSTLARRFQSAWSQVLAGSPTDFVQALKQAGYFTGDVNAYSNGVVSYFNRFAKSIPGSVEPLLPEAPLWELVAVMLSGMTAGALGYLAWKRAL